MKKKVISAFTQCSYYIITYDFKQFHNLILLLTLSSLKLKVFIYKKPFWLTKNNTSTISKKIILPAGRNV